MYYIIEITSRQKQKVIGNAYFAVRSPGTIARPTQSSDMDYGPTGQDYGLRVMSLETLVLR